jgi:hypothetical protein
MYSETARLGLPEPRIDEIGMRYRFTVFLKEAVSAEVTEQVGKLLRCFGEGPVAEKNLMKTVGFSHRPTFFHDYLQPALDAGLIEMTISTSPEAVNKNTV